MNVPSHVRRVAAAGRIAVCLSVSLLCLQGATAGAALAASSSAEARDLADTARDVKHGESLRIEGVQLDGEEGLTGLELTRLEVLAEGARIVAQTDAGPRPLKPAVPVYLRGTVDGRPGSIAVIGVRASGEIRGLISTSSGTWLLGSSRKTAGRLRSAKADPAALARARRFSCEVRDNPRRAAAAALPAAPTGAPPPTPALPTSYTARIAVELDYEYYSAFGSDADTAALYALDLVAFTGSISESELGMSVLVPFIQVWTTAADPYSGTSGRLDQVRNWWNSNDPSHCGGVACSSIERTTTLYLSSAPTGGVAFLPGICDWHSDPLGSYSYAYAGSIYGDFDIASPDSVWDIVVTSHELGHNFGSTHTHCFSPPIDECYGAEGGCYAGAESLPAGCPGSGQGCGTIMSYCHLLTGGMANVSLTYGTGHPYGTDTSRVPDAMLAELAAQYAAVPACLAPAEGMKALAVNKTGTGTGVLTTIPAGISCGGACRAYFDGNQVVQLVATPGAFSDFAGWSGDPDCADGTVTLSTAVSCTATFNGNCGPSNLDCTDGDVCTVDTCVADDHCLSSGIPIDAASCFASGTAKLQIKESATLGADRLTWKWGKGDAFAQADLGSPAIDTTYTLCIYDSSAATPNLAAKLVIPPAAGLWKSRDPNGWNYKDKAALADGVQKLQLKTGIDGTTSVKLSARGLALTLPAAFSVSEFFDEDPSVVVQLVDGATKCWSSEFVALRTSLNTPAGFKAVAP